MTPARHASIIVSRPIREALESDESEVVILFGTSFFWGAPVVEVGALAPGRYPGMNSPIRPAKPPAGTARGLGCVEIVSIKLCVTDVVAEIQSYVQVR